MTTDKFSLNRRHLLATAAGASALLAAPSLLRAQTSEITIAAWGGAYEKTLREAIIPAFEKDHGAKVTLEIGVGSTFIPKIVSSPRSAPYDVVYLNDDEAYLGQSAGLWADDMSSSIANVENVYPSMKPPVVPFYGAICYDFPLVYNKDKFPTAPTSWNDLLTMDGAVGIPHVSNSYGLIFLYIAAKLNGGDANNLEPGFAAIKKIKNLKIYKGVTQGFTMFQQGELDAALFYGHRAIQLIEQGLPLARAYPKEGVWGMRAGAQIPKKAKNVEMAKLWISTMESPAYQELFAKSLYSPSNKTVVLDGDLAKNCIYGEERVNALQYPDWNAINPQRDDILTRFTKEFAA